MAEQGPHWIVPNPSPEWPYKEVSSVRGDNINICTTFQRSKDIFTPAADRSFLSLYTCACPRCKPGLYRTIAHSEDRTPFNVLRGLSWRSHDAWHLAVTIAATFSDKPPGQSLHQRWKNWEAAYLKGHSRVLVICRLPEHALATAVDIFSDLFFGGQLPSSSRVRVVRCALAPGRFGEVLPLDRHRKFPCTIRLNTRRWELQTSIRAVLATILHEMTHAFFQIYSCQPLPFGEKKTSGACSYPQCQRLYLSNLGLSGHGRAWQHLVRAIERALPSALGFEVSLGCIDGLVSELKLLGPLPCHHDARILYPWLKDRWWGSLLCSKDDDTVLQRRLRNVTRALSWAGRMDCVRGAGGSGRRGRRRSI